MDPFLLDIPEEIKIILKGDFNNINPKHLKVIQEKDPYDFPGGLSLDKEVEIEQHMDSDESDDELLVHSDSEEEEIPIQRGNDKQLHNTAIKINKHNVEVPTNNGSTGKTNLPTVAKSNKFMKRQMPTIREGRTLNLRQLPHIKYGK